MDTQMKKGLLEVCVLKSIQNEESYGYQILATVSPLIEITESTLYPILKRIELSGYAQTHTAEFGGRLRKYYKITKEGIARLELFKAEHLQMEKIYAFLGVKENI
ncbi:MAG: PadR family transcriptional regulator [Bacillota bacterium]